MESSPVNYLNYDNHSFNETLDKEPKNYKICKHIRDKFFNNFTRRPNLHKLNQLSSTEKSFSTNSSSQAGNFIQMESFFNLSKLSTSNFQSSNLLMKNYFDSFYIKNLNLDWIALDNPQNLSFSSINRDGCLFTIAFDDSGEFMASSNHNHHIEIWNTNPSKRKIIKTIKDHKEIVTGLEFFHGDSSYMMSCSLDKTIQLWKDFENKHTFLDHSDWVRCLSLSKDNKHFLSGCVSSVVKLWDLETQTVLKTINNQNPDPDLLNTVNSLMFMNMDDHVFLCGLRNGTVKLFDTRVDTFNHLTREFKAHKNKLNSIKFNHNDKYLLSSGRDSLCRLWDMRKLPIGENPDLNANYCVNEYKGHLCKGFNIETNFFCQEKYIVTGSEDSFIYIYDTISSDLVMKYKTNQKCVNLVKPFPMKSHNYSLVYTGLEDVSIYVMNTNKVLGKNVEKNYSGKKEREGKQGEVNLSQVQDNNFSDYEEILNVEEKEQNKHMKLIEEIMSECGDLILRIFHSNNLTYSNGMNFEHLMEIIQRNNDEESLRIMQILNEKFMKKIMESLMNEAQERRSPQKKKTGQTESKTTSQADNSICVNCLLCQGRSNYEMATLDYDIFMVYDDYYQDPTLLDLPNEFDSFQNMQIDQAEKLHPLINNNFFNNDINIDSDYTCNEEKNKNFKVIKTLYSNESFAMKYNYLLNKFI